MSGRCFRCERVLEGASYFFGGHGPLCATCLVKMEAASHPKRDRPLWKWLVGVKDMISFIFMRGNR